MSTANITLSDLIDALIDIEQEHGGSLKGGLFPVIGAFPDVTMLRVKKPALMTHTSRIPLFGIEKGQTYISLKLA